MLTKRPERRIKDRSRAIHAKLRADKRSALAHKKSLRDAGYHMWEVCKRYIAVHGPEIECNCCHELLEFRESFDKENDYPVMEIKHCGHPCKNWCNPLGRKECIPAEIWRGELLELTTFN